MWRPFPTPWLDWKAVFQFLLNVDDSLLLSVPVSSTIVKLFGQAFFSNLVALSNSSHMQPFPSTPSLPSSQKAFNVLNMVFPSSTEPQDSMVEKRDTSFSVKVAWGSSLQKDAWWISLEKYTMADFRPLDWLVIKMRSVRLRCFEYYGPWDVGCHRCRIFALGGKLGYLEPTKN